MINNIVITSFILNFKSFIEILINTLKKLMNILQLFEINFLDINQDTNILSNNIDNIDNNKFLINYINNIENINEETVIKNKKFLIISTLIILSVTILYFYRGYDTNHNNYLDKTTQTVIEKNTINLSNLESNLANSFAYTDELLEQLDELLKNSIQ
jgi:hypothetical protein